MEDVSKYAHSPAHLAVARRDHDCLRRIVAALPPLPRAGEVTTEEESLAAEAIADTVSAVIDRRDVPRRETPLHLAVKLRDPISADILVSVGADVSLQNGKGWSALQEAVWRREERIAMIIYRQSQPLSWAKWCRRLPRIVSSIKRIQDFYMEITFHFESSVIPFISRIAPSDTYRIWKRGPNLRADMTLAGFDGFKIKRSDNTVLFLGEGAPAEGGRPVVSAGSLLVLSHKNKEITNALEGEGSKPTEAQVAHKVAQMSRTNMYRPGIDVTKAQLVPHLNWRRQERTEMVGNWKAKVYDMHHVMLILKSRTVPGATTNEELNAAGNDEKTKDGDLDNILTSEEKMQLDLALQDQSKGLGESDSNGATCELSENPRLHGTTKDKKSRFGSTNKKASKTNGDDAKKKNTKLLHKNGDCKSEEIEDINRRKEKRTGKKKPGTRAEPSKTESEFKNGLRPVLWLTPDFPLKTDELLPLLDVLANKGKAVRRLRELLTTKLPLGTFPVKIAIPIVPTIRVIVTFTKFEKVQTDDEFATPPSSPTYFQESKTKKAEGSGSWYSWVRGGRAGSLSDRFDGPTSKDEVDPFNLPSDYVWIDISEKMRRMKARRKAKSK